MTFNIAKFYIHFFCRQMVFSLKHWGVICLLVVFLIFGVLFYGLIITFKQQYISSLKGIYPEMYVQDPDETIMGIVPGVTIEKELFQISGQLRFRFAPDGKNILFHDIGKRAFAPDRLPAVIRAEEAGSRASNTAWVNTALLQKLSGSRDFDGQGICIVARDNSCQYVQIAQFSMLGKSDKDWLVLSGDLAQILGMTFNIGTIYTDETIGTGSLVDAYAAYGYKVFHWSDRLPFFNIVLYRLGSISYAVFMTSSMFLVVFLLISVFHDMLRECRKIIGLSIIYGVRRVSVFLVFTLFTVMYAGACHLIAGVALSSVIGHVAAIFPIVGSVSGVSLLLYSFLALLPLLVALNAAVFQRIYSEGYVAFED